MAFDLDDEELESTKKLFRKQTDEEILRNIIAEYDAAVEDAKDHYIMTTIDRKGVIALENLINRVKELEEKYKRLSIEAQATAFDDENQDTELLMRVLLKQGEIRLDENGYYERKDFDWEENLHKVGLMKKREKSFYIPDNECLDEYTKQLESQLKEYNEIKEIFKKYYVFPNETIYDGCCKMQDEIDELKEKVKELEKYEKYYHAEINLLDSYIPKSKIQEKIEEVKNRKENYIFEKVTSEDIRRTIITNLQELLEEQGE